MNDFLLVIIVGTAKDPYLGREPIEHTLSFIYWKKDVLSVKQNWTVIV